MKAICLTLSFLLMSACLFAQMNPMECGTPSPLRDHLKDIDPATFRVVAGTRLLKMHIIIYSDDNGSNTAIDESVLATEIKFSNSIYNMGDICFAIVGIEFRNSTEFNNPANSSKNYSSQVRAGAFNVFLVRSIGGETGEFGTFGWSPNTPASYMVTRTAGFGTRRTFIHEMGHALGLSHTFKGTGDEPADPGTPELVNGSNGTTAGDFVEDTPADPYDRCGVEINGCTFPYTAPACKDANNQSFAPQMNNFLSYWANFNCNRTVFTAGQYARMRQTIDNTPFLTAFLAPDYVTLNGTTIGSGWIQQAAKYNMGLTNYQVSGSAQATYSAGGSVQLNPTFVAAPGASGVVRILASTCQ